MEISRLKQKKDIVIHDGKGYFYSTLELDKETKAFIHWYRKLRKELMNTP